MTLLTILIFSNKPKLWINLTIPNPAFSNLAFSKTCSLLSDGNDKTLPARQFSIFLLFVFQLLISNNSLEIENLEWRKTKSIEIFSSHQADKNSVRQPSRMSSDLRWTNRGEIITRLTKLILRCLWPFCQVWCPCPPPCTLPPSPN